MGPIYSNCKGLRERALIYSSSLHTYPLCFGQVARKHRSEERADFLVTLGKTSQITNITRIYIHWYPIEVKKLGGWGGDERPLVGLQ